MLFSEVYGSYFNAVAAVLSEACDGTLTNRRLNEIIREKAFGESGAQIAPALTQREWPLITEDYKTPIKHKPTMPLTLLQKRWLKALLADPRIHLFDVPTDGLEDVTPLYEQETFTYFDRYLDGDPFEDEKYIEHFRLARRALREKRKLRICFTGGDGRQRNTVCIPWRLEYSSKDDKFRLLTAGGSRSLIINLARIVSAELLEPYDEEPVLPAIRKNTLEMELVDERNALERVMLHFSHLEKETVRQDGRHYRITLHYDKDDETEMLIRVLSFGPMLKVTGPERFVGLILERIERQKKMQCHQDIF